MEEVIHIMYQGSKLVTDLESTLPNLSNHPELLLKSCDEITNVFASARDKLNAWILQSSSKYQILQEQQQHIDPSLHEWIKRQILSASRSSTTTSNTQLGVSSEGDAQANVNVLDSGRPGSSNSQRPAPRRRKGDGEKRTVTLPAPQHGNTDLPPEDGFTWRKYGQKEILGCKFPRGYYRCTHQKLYHCPAKKQVQRLDNDPYMFEVTYRGIHTCHMSSTAPSVAPPPPEFTQGMSHHTSITTTSTSSTTFVPNSIPSAQWLSMEYRGRGASSAMAGGSSVGCGAGPSSSTRYGAADSVADMVDVMFNSGSSSTTNSIDFIFHPVDNKWDHSEDKNN
ncbi:WRKY transcription factor 55-like [Rutidosis leptorrhynchoides]|uniref:WRKY transcription factor 55-like n=1 Tax=Rutidosis leptorrhynchoides TaxID=125765 RepID=UPI003A9A40D5